MSADAPRRHRRPAGRVLVRAALSSMLASAALVVLPAPADPPVPRLAVAEVALTGRAAPAGPGWRATVANPNSGQLVGLAWDGPATAEVRIRTQRAGGWDDWLVLENAGDEVPDAEGSGQPSIAPVWIGDDVHAVQLQVDDGSLADLHAWWYRIDLPGPSLLQASAAEAYPLLPVIPRSAWGAEPFSTSTAGCEDGPKVTQPRYAIVHHTDGSNTYTPQEAYGIVRAIQSFHIHTNGWCDIAYNFLIDRFGQVFEGRDGGIDRGVIGGHARGFNTGSIGVSLIGNFVDTSVPAATSSSLQQLIAWKFAHHGIDANARIWVQSACPDAATCRYGPGVMVLLPTITTHRDVGITACPGTYGAAVASAIRAPIADAVLRDGPFHPRPGWQPSTDGPKVLTLDALGGIHPAGGAPTVPATAYWPTYPIARTMVGTASAGYVIDGLGGVHPYGSASAVSSQPRFGFDAVRGAALGSTPTSGYILDAFGGVHPFGGVVRPTTTAYWSGWDIARDIVTLPGGLGGYVLDGFGGLHPFGIAGQTTTSGYWSGWDIARAIARRPDAPGGYVLDGFGGLHPWGGAPPIGVTGYSPGSDSFRDVVLLPGGGGYTVDSAGAVFPIGSSTPINTQLTWQGYPYGRAIVAG